jgi:hypothetical protein
VLVSITIRCGRLIQRSDRGERCDHDLGALGHRGARWQRPPAGFFQPLTRRRQHVVAGNLETVGEQGFGHRAAHDAEADDSDGGLHLHLSPGCGVAVIVTPCSTKGPVANGYLLPDPDLKQWGYRHAEKRL